ncbi:MAG TPA: alpha/beta fold hydrolase [Anaerolineales bacterium]|nr:alpha/beta fold hydrolase [Anaerolineales bacterium]
MQLQETKAFSIDHSIHDGMEWITYTPQQRRFATPILMQHGMWHGAWCWQSWQELFAEWGWESHAISLPGHAGSPAQRPVYFCTLGYYLQFLKTAVQRLPCKPILMGHSMGGALLQWYFKYVDNELPAAVLVAPWDLWSTLSDGAFLRWLRLDPIGVLLASLLSSTRPYIRTPKQAAKKLISSKSIYTPEELHAHLSPESVWVMYQHTPPFWYPPKEVKTPLLWLAGEADTVIGVESERKSAAYYQADFLTVPEAAHNIMMEHNYCETAKTIHEWLIKRGLK